MDLLLALLAEVLEALGLGARPPPESSTVAVARTPAEARALLLRLGQRLGFEVTDGAARVSMRGVQDGLPIRVEVPFHVAEGQVRFHLHIVVESHAPLLAPWGIFPRDSAPGGSWPLGDPRLDEVLRVVGEDVVVATAVDPLVRDMVVGLSGSLEVRPDAVSFQATRAATFLERLVAQLVALTRRLAQTPSVTAAALLARFKGEPLPELRERCLAALLSRHPEAPESVEAARRGLKDPSAKVQLRAALHLGEEAQPTLRTLAGEPGLDAGLRLSAARALGNLEGELQARLEAQARHLDERIAVPALRLLGRFGPATTLALCTWLVQDSLRAPRIREVARQSAGRLQARFPAAGQGHLSLVAPGPDEGGLSLADGPGALSPTE